MQKNIFEKYPKLITFISSVTIIGSALSLIWCVLNITFLQDFPGGEKYSIIDKIIYEIRCDDHRSIKLRENKPNHDYIRAPGKAFETLEDKEYHLRTDNNGIIKPSFVHANPDLQIFFVGGSTTECETVDEEFRFPYLVGRKLEKSLGVNVNSDNAAKSGNNSLHSINIIINKLLAYNPDMIVMMENINDLSVLFYEGSYWNDNKTTSNLVCAVKHKKAKKKHRHGDLDEYDEWRDSVWQGKVLSDQKEQDRLVEQFRENLKLFINICRSRNVVPVLMTQANRIEQDPNFKTRRGANIDTVYKKLYIKFNQTIRRVGKEQKVLVIDLAKNIPSDKKYIYDIVHYNKTGSILASDLISEQLNAYIKQTNLLLKKK